MKVCRAADVHKPFMRAGIKATEDLFLQQRPLELHLAQSMVELMYNTLNVPRSVGMGQIWLHINLLAPEFYI